MRKVYKTGRGKEPKIENLDLSIFNDQKIRLSSVRDAWDLTVHLIHSFIHSFISLLGHSFISWFICSSSTSIIRPEAKYIIIKTNNKKNNKHQGDFLEVSVKRGSPLTGEETEAQRI